MLMERIAIVEGIRTPFSRMGANFNGLSAQELGRIAARELIERMSLDVRLIDEVIFGCVGQPADAANLARVIALLAGIPHRSRLLRCTAIALRGLKLSCRLLLRSGLGKVRVI